LGKVRLFTEIEKQFIKDNYQIMTAKEIGVILARSASVVKQQSFRMGLKKRTSVDLTEEQREFIRTHYQSMTYEQMAKSLECKASTVASHVYRNCQIKYPRINKKDILLIEKHKDNKNNKDLAKLLGLSASSVKHYFRRNNVERYLPAGTRYSVNKLFFRDLNALNCYWGGFLAADGCVVKDRPCISVTLQEKDRCLLERFKTDIGYTGPINSRQRKTKGIIRSYATLKINGVPQWCEDLKAHFNVVPQKSHILEPPNLSGDVLIKAYICGIIDGDGSISRDKRGYFYVSITGTEMLLSWIKNLFDAWYPSEKLANIRPYKRKKSWEYRIKGRRAEAVLQDLSTLDIPKLERKWNILNPTSV
jgi:DNA-binding CsgD family transcriptional regulator